jgi:hypothetical protein
MTYNIESSCMEVRLYYIKWLLKVHLLVISIVFNYDNIPRIIIQLYKKVSVVETSFIIL